MLKSFLKPKKKFNLIRLGNKFDGGYLVDKNSILSSKNLLSFGINDDWSFEKDFLKYQNIPLYAFDYSIGKYVFFIRFLESLQNIGKFLYLIRMETEKHLKKVYLFSKEKGKLLLLIWIMS